MLAPDEQSDTAHTAAADTPQGHASPQAISMRNRVQRGVGWFASGATVKHREM